jgi:putative intracellular protease/amidase
MKKVFVMLISMLFLLSFSKEKPKVLMYLEGNSVMLGYMLTHEVGKMKELLRNSGIEVTTATLSGELLKADSISLKPDIKLSEADIKGYDGFILPCMAADTIVTTEEVEFVKKAANAGKPVAAQLGAVLILAKAGVLDGKKYCWMNDSYGNPGMFPEFKNGIYSGVGVIQDGMVITSGLCPAHAKMSGKKDGTEELTNKLIETIRSKTN